MSRLNKILISIVAVFTVASIGVTYYVINNQSNKKSEEKEVEPIIKEPDYGDIIVDENTNKRVNDNAKGFTSFIDPIIINPITFLEDGSVSGLKDKNVQKRINDVIKSNKGSVGSNYNNVLSISYYDENRYVSRFLTFRLDTGEELKFEELFTSDADISKILSLGIYENMAWDACEPLENGVKYCDDVNTTKIDYAAIEDETFRLINYYKANGVKDFGISDGYIWFKIDKEWFKTYIGDCYQDVAVYNRFKAKTDIYEKTIDSKKQATIFGKTITNLNYSIYDYRHEKIADNVYVEIFEDCSFCGNDGALFRSNVETAINKAKTYASNNKNKGYYLYGLPSNDGTFTLKEMDIKYFNGDLEKDIIKSAKTNLFALVPYNVSFIANDKAKTLTEFFK